MPGKTEYKTSQEEFWANDFGGEYISRNDWSNPRSDLRHLFRKVFTPQRGIRSVLELGASIGCNLSSIHQLAPEAELHALEINAKAYRELASHDFVTRAHHGSILEFRPDRTYDLVFTKGVLIHVNPRCLPMAYELMYMASDRYIFLAEYYNPTPVEVPYRNHSKNLFKRDFAGELMDAYPDLELVDYGFVYHRDPHHPLDDLTWFLMEKTA